MKFFFDNNLSERLVIGMQGFGENVIHLKSIFQDDTPDIMWLKHIGEKRIFLITRDLKIRWRPAEREAFKCHNVGAFFLGGKNQSRCQLIQQVVRNFPRIKEFSSKNRNKRPFAFRVPPAGTKFTEIIL